MFVSGPSLRPIEGLLRANGGLDVVIASSLTESED